jgi:putative thioredoxin
MLGQDAPVAGGNLIKDTTTQAFRADVIAESAKQPVLVDFWAPWCGPCKQLTPILEKVVQQAGGKVKLVKMNIDEHPDISGQLGIQSIPAVIAFQNGQPADGFMGALPEGQVKAFIERLVGALRSEVDDLIEAAEEAFGAEQYEGAAQAYGQAAQLAPDNIKALAGHARSLVELGDLETAKTILDGFSPDQQRNQAAAAARAALEIAEQAAGAGDVGELKARLEKDPNDHQAPSRSTPRATATGRAMRSSRSSDAIAPGTMRRRANSCCNSSKAGG